MRRGSVRSGFTSSDGSARLVLPLVGVVSLLAGTPSAAAALPSGTVRAAQSTAAGAAVAFGSSGLDGAGFQNVLAASPFMDAAGRRPLLAGADVAGVHQSLDGGRTWSPSDRGLGDQHVATLMFSRDTPGKVYAGTDSGMYVSADFGGQWIRRPAPVDFDANGVYELDGATEHPRPTGRLLAQDTSGPSRYIWAATATQGVKRSADDGNTWETVALAGEHLRSIALDPARPDVLYVAAAHGGLFVSTNARGAMTFTRVAGSPDTAEELTFAAGKLYVAAGASGVFLYDGAWHALNAGLPAGAAWESIVGYRTAAGNTVLYTGCTAVQGGKAVMKSTDGGGSWTTISTGAGVTVSPTMYGSSDAWWAKDLPYLRFAGPNFVSSQIIIDPDDVNSVLIAGRGGIWHGSTAASTTSWAPAVKGLQVTVNMAVAADPKAAGRVYLGSMDYTSLASGDHGAHIVRSMPAGAPSTGDVISLDPGTPSGQPSAVYLGASQRGTNTGVGGVWSNADPLNSASPWQSEALPVSSDVPALGVGHPAGQERVILAGVSARGLWRKTGSSWAQVGGTAPFQSSAIGSFAWVKGTSTVYAIDTTGVWLSSSAGAAGSWVKLMAASSSYGTLDALAVDPTDGRKLYVSTKSLGGVWRLDVAGGTAAPIRILALGDPGPIAMDPAGALYVHDAGGSRLLRSVTPGASTPSFAAVSDSYYGDNKAGIRSLAVGPDGYVYTPPTTLE